MIRYFICHESKFIKKFNIYQILSEAAFNTKSLSVFVFRKSTDTGEDNPFNYAKKIGLKLHTRYYMRHERSLTLTSLYCAYSGDNTCILLR